MRTIIHLVLAAFALILPNLAAAQSLDGGARVVSTERWVEEWDHVSQSWVRVADGDPAEILANHTAQGDVITTVTEIVDGVVTTQTTTVLRDAARFQALNPARQSDQAIAQYGPFMVLDDRRAAIVGSTDAAAPLYFDAMLSDFPEIEVLEMIEAPGTSHDLANLEVGRRIRAAGLSTYVPNGGSVRSGAVELFLAGATRTIDDGAEFAVHSWLDVYGRQPQDFAPDAPENRLYLDYYMEMGMSEARARDFYAMTNSVPHHSALWLDGGEMRGWVKEYQEWEISADQWVNAGASSITDGHLDVQLSETKIDSSLAKQSAEPA